MAGMYHPAARAAQRAVNQTLPSTAIRSGGKRSAKVLPLPGSLLISSSASCRMAMCLVMARPSPVPPTARERPRSTR